MLKPVTTGIPECLPSLALFQGLDEGDLECFAAGVTETPARCGAIVFREGDACTGLHFVISGQVRLSLRTAKGQEKVLRLVGEGEGFGAVALFLGERYTMTADAITHTRLLHVAKETVVAQVKKNAAFGERVIRELCHQLHQRTVDLHGYLLLSGTQRVASYLLSCLPRDMNGSPAVAVLPAKKGIIASRLNLTHEHFSRILRELTAAGLIEVDGRDVIIRDVGRLRARYAR